MRPSGEASRIAVAGAALDAFGALDDTGRRAFFHSLLDDYGAEIAFVSPDSGFATAIKFTFPGDR